MYSPLVDFLGNSLSAKHLKPHRLRTSFIINTHFLFICGSSPPSQHLYYIIKKVNVNPFLKIFFVKFLTSRFRHFIALKY
nr:MAG TPA: hypothetical protein [Caudoviricetes sp.]